MSSIEEVRARITLAVTKVNDSQGIIHKAIDEYEAALAELQAATEGSNQEAFHEAASALMQTIDLLKQAAGASQNAGSIVEQGGASL